MHAASHSPTDNLGVSIISPPTASPTSPTDNSGDGLRNITREEEYRAVPLTPPEHNPGAIRTLTSATLSTSMTDNYGDVLREHKDLNNCTRARKQDRKSFLATSPINSSGDALSKLTREERGRRKHPTPSPMSPTDNPGDVRQQSSVHFKLHIPGFLDIPLRPERRSMLPESTPPTSTIIRASERRTVIQSPGRWSARPMTPSNHPERTDAQEPTMATPGANIEALASLQAYELSKITEIIQGLVAARTAKEKPTPPTSQAPHIPATIAGEDKTIIWEQVGTGHIPNPEVPPTRPQTPNDPTQGQTR